MSDKLTLKLLQDYCRTEGLDFNEHNVITSPGKFEGEYILCPYLWNEYVMISASDETTIDPQDDTCYDFFDTTNKEEFPEEVVSLDVKTVALFTSSQGFVHMFRYTIRIDEVVPIYSTEIEYDENEIDDITQTLLGENNNEL